MSERPCEVCPKKAKCWLNGNYMNCEELKKWNKKVTADIDFG